MTSSLFTFQRAKFEEQFRSHYGDAFQKWFYQLAGLLHAPGDVQSIRLTQGDGKLDVAVLGEQLVYQCYAPAPAGFKSAIAVKKITTDFWGAFDHLQGKLRKWIFVHNHATGELDKTCYKAMSDIVSECQKRGHAIQVEAWGINTIWDALQQHVPYAALRTQFGSPDPVYIDYACIEELLLRLERAPYPEDTLPVSLPALVKLEYNHLGPAYKSEIRSGRTAMHQVEQYLRSRATSHPEFGEQLGQRFRDRYRQLKERGLLTADEIYDNLRLDAGWAYAPNAQRELATRAILAYFFESCDIFENPLSP